MYGRVCVKTDFQVMLVQRAGRWFIEWVWGAENHFRTNDNCSNIDVMARKGDVINYELRKKGYDDAHKFESFTQKVIV
jgi:hypothetical protein